MSCSFQDLEPRFCTCDWPHADQLVEEDQQQSLQNQKNIFGVAEIKASPLVPPTESNVTDDKVSSRTTTAKPDEDISGSEANVIQNVKIMNIKSNLY